MFSFTRSAILRRLKKVEHKQHVIMAAIDDLKASVSLLETSNANLSAAVAALGTPVTEAQLAPIAAAVASAASGVQASTDTLKALTVLPAPVAPAVPLPGA